MRHLMDDFDASHYPFSVLLSKGRKVAASWKSRLKNECLEMNEKENSSF